MATVVKDFKVKAGLIVEGANATVGGYDVLKKSTDDENYIISLVTGGGGSDSENTPNTVVLRDENGDFAAGTITAETKFVGDLEGDVTGTVSDISNHDTDDLTEGANNLYFSDLRAKTAVSNALGTGIVYSDEGTGNVFHIDENVVATKDYVDGLTTTDIEEGTNEYFTTTRARSAVSGGDGVSYDSATGIIAANLGNGLQISGGQIVIDDNVVATDSDVSTAVSNHSALTTGVHGVTGDVVGTSDTQTLSNKTIDGVLNLGVDGSTVEDVEGDLTLTANGNLNIVSTNGDIVLNPDGHAYLTSVSEGNKVASQSYVDNAVSGLDWKNAVNLLAVTNVDMTGNTGTLVIDGHDALVTADAGYRILLTNQDVDAENGIYVYTEAAGVYTLVRSADADDFSELLGAAVFVMEGTTYGQTSWVQSNHYLEDFTTQDWVQFSGSGSVVAGTGITVDGLEVSIDRTTVDTWYDAAGTAATEAGLVQDNLDDHSAATTGVHGILTSEGNVVGTLKEQTLENKTLGSGTVLGADLDAVNTYKVTNLVDPTANQDAATKKYVDDEVSSINTAIDNLTTADVAEDAGFLYFTDERAVDAAAAAIVAGDHITVNYDDNAGTITIIGENGVADSTTDDLAEGTQNKYFTNARVEAVIATTTTDDIDEGSENLYFTDERAVTALEAVVPNFTEIDINSIATQIAAENSGDAAQNVIAYTFPVADYRSAKFLVKVAYGTHTEVSEVLLTLDTGNNIALTEYAIVGTNGSTSLISADVASGNVRLIVTPVNNGSTIKVMGTLLV